MFLVRVERRAVPERDHESRVVGPRRADNILANLEVDDSVYITERAQPLAVLCARRGIDVALVLETDEVDDHHSSSPSISSSATSTTTLWTSMRNHCRNVLRSR